MNTNETVNENIRYLLWQHDVPPSEWAAQLASWVGCQRARAEEILDGAAVTGPEQENIIEKHPGLSIENLNYQRLVEQDNILGLNLQHLIDNFDGKQTDLAKKLHVAPFTVTRWKKGDQQPRHTQLQALCHEFYLPPDTDLERDALFLSRFPIGIQQKRWLKQQIDRLSAEKLDAHFPSLYRILKDP